MAISRRILRIVATLSVFGLISACGYKGPLYMPPSQDSDRSSATPAHPKAQDERPRIPSNPTLP
ncbi:LPS translocon maturation chaperone LptM [Bordetella trematum]|uniref:LPS translocon maturation chaperone LptM n=1 Tax=Bordetella trematum TaxID=123899 RepID=UPI001E37A967|nr:lipoprotein [Bordetella trematum]